MVRDGVLMNQEKLSRQVRLQIAGLEISVIASLTLQSIANIAAVIYFAPSGAPITLIATVGCAFAAIPFLTVRNACRLGRFHQAHTRRGAR